MQNEDISHYAADKSSTSSSTPLDFFSSNPFLSPMSPTCVNSDASFYSSLFHNHSSGSPSDTASFDGGETVQRLQDASYILEYQQLYNRYKLCLSQLHDSIEEVAALRCENESLRRTNADIGRRVALLFARDRLFSDLNRLNIASPSAAAPRASHMTATQPLAEYNRVGRRNTERATLPKSISVRRDSYLKMSQPGRDTTGHKEVSQIAAASRVYVPAGSEKKEALELDVYNQGMWKTELCNKWQENGACLYGENCQFAHGIKELRPVIRHPRYKTEVCRMMLTGGICPYGHRCHFRHTLTEQEKLMAAAPPR